MVEPGYRPPKSAERADVGAVPAVDGLVGIADDAEVGSLGAPRLEQMELQWVDVLELVDEEMSEPPPLHGGEVTVVAHRACALDEHVVEVDQPAFALQPLVALVDRRHDRRCQRRPAAGFVARGPRTHRG